MAELWTTWDLEPLVLGCITVSGLLYAAGLRRLWKSAGRGKGIRVWEAWCFALGWFALVLALISPLHPLGGVLFSAHMIQHEVLILAAAPLLVLGRPMVPFLWALPDGGAQIAGGWTKASWWRAFWRFITRPVAAWLIHAVALWAWHIPVLFESTLHNELMHTLQHVSFFGSALLFWWALLHRGMKRYGMAVLGLFTTALHSGLLGVLLTFANRVWYPSYVDTVGLWGLTPLEDQQIGGLIMWIPAGLIYTAAALALFAGWLRESEERSKLSFDVTGKIA